MTGRSSSYKGEILYPVLVDYPEEKFGGFWRVTDYRDPFIQEEIEAKWLDTLAADPLFLHHRQLRHASHGRPDRAVLAAR
jgi:ABC-type microcin C transport system permease subunit YejE